MLSSESADVGQDPDDQITGRLGRVVAVYALDGDMKDPDQVLSRDGQVAVRGQRLQVRSKEYLTKYWELGRKETLEKFLTRRTSALRVSQIRAAGFERLQDEILDFPGVDTNDALHWLAGPWFSAFVDAASLCESRFEETSAGAPPGPLCSFQLTDNGAADTCVTVNQFYLQALIKEMMPSRVLSATAYTSFGGIKARAPLLRTMCFCLHLTELDVSTCGSLAHVPELVRIVLAAGKRLTTLRVHVSALESLPRSDILGLRLGILVVSCAASELSEQHIKALTTLGTKQCMLRFVDIDAVKYDRETHELLSHFFKFVAWPVAQKKLSM